MRSSQFLEGKEYFPLQNLINYFSTQLYSHVSDLIQPMMTFHNSLCLLSIFINVFIFNSNDHKISLAVSWCIYKNESIRMGGELLKGLGLMATIYYSLMTVCKNITLEIWYQSSQFLSVQSSHYHCAPKNGLK